jgi:phosphoesterase RecJ-like protein
MTFSKEQIAQLEHYISQSTNIVLVNHASPDADTIGSALALQRVLLQMGKKATVVCPNPIPDFLEWMPGSEEILIHDNKAKKSSRAIREADLLFAMDFNAPYRTANVEKQMNSFIGKKVLIDHHLFPQEDYFDLMFSYPEKSSTSELLFDILRASSYKKFINKDVAVNIFVGLMTDTGSFAYSCNTPETFESAAELIRYGVDVKETHDLIYNNNSVERLQILGYSIDEALKIFPEHHAAYISLSKEILDKYGNKEGLTEGIVNYALSVKGICFAALMSEKDNKIKLSFRSKGNFNVNSFARAHFEGGGHHNAAGGKSFLTLEETGHKLEELIKKIDIKCQ